MLDTQLLGSGHQTTNKGEMDFFCSYTIDWTAFAAITALLIWLCDGCRRRKERRASRRLIAQIMVGPVGKARIEIARFRTALVSSDGDVTKIFTLIDSQPARREVANDADKICIDLPSQFIDKADLFSERTTNRLAYALIELSQLHSVWRICADHPDQADKKPIEDNLALAMKQIQKAEKALEDAFKVLIAEGKASLWANL